MAVDSENPSAPGNSVFKGIFLNTFQNETLDARDMDDCASTADTSLVSVRTAEELILELKQRISYLDLKVIINAQLLEGSKAPVDGDGEGAVGEDLGGGWKRCAADDWVGVPLGLTPTQTLESLDLAIGECFLDIQMIQCKN